MQYNLCFNTNAIKDLHGEFALAAFITGIYEFDQTLTKSGWTTYLNRSGDDISIRFWLDEKKAEKISSAKFIKEFGGWKNKVAKLAVHIFGKAFVRHWMISRMEEIKKQDAEYRDSVVVDRINDLLQHGGVTAYRGGQMMRLPDKIPNIDPAR